MRRWRTKGLRGAGMEHWTNQSNSRPAVLQRIRSEMLCGREARQKESVEQRSYQMKVGHEKRGESEMNILVWLLVLGVACGIGYVLLIRRLGKATPFNSIYQGAADHAHEEAAGASGQWQHSPEA